MQVTGALPSWVWDLLADLIDEEDVHPVLYRESLGLDPPRYRQYGWCPKLALERVPAETLRVARYIAGYRQSAKELAT